VLLAAPEFDVSRVGTILRRVVTEADALEQIHLPTLDQPLELFEADLKNEGVGPCLTGEHSATAQNGS